MEKLEENNRVDNTEDKKDNLANRDETTDPLHTSTPLPVFISINNYINDNIILVIFIYFKYSILK